MREQLAQQPPVIRSRASAITQPAPSEVPALPTRSFVTEQQQKQPRIHWLTAFGIGMLLVVMVMFLWNYVLVPRWQDYQDQLHYGDARLTRLDADVGHGGVSTFIAFDLHGQVMVIEMPGGRVEHTRLYRVTNLIGQGFDQKIITLSVRDMNGDGKPDLVVHIEGESTDIVLYNNGTGFQWSAPK